MRLAAVLLLATATFTSACEDEAPPAEGSCQALVADVLGGVECNVALGRDQSPGGIENVANCASQTFGIASPRPCNDDLDACYDANPDDPQGGPCEQQHEACLAEPPDLELLAWKVAYRAWCEEHGDGQWCETSEQIGCSASVE